MAEAIAEGATQVIGMKVELLRIVGEQIIKGAQQDAEILEKLNQADAIVNQKYQEFAKKGYVDDAKMTLARGKMGILPTGSIPIDNPVGAVPAVISKVKERYPLSKLG